MGIFGRNIDKVYAARGELRTPPAPPLAIASPWAPQDSLVTWAIDDALGALLESDTLILTRDVALRIPAVKRAHGIHVTQFADVKFRQMNDATPTPEQPRWLTTSNSGVSPYHRMQGLGSDFFFHGWGCLSWTADLSDCMHVPFGLWKVADDGSVQITDNRIPAAYRARPVAIPVGYGENGLLADGADAIREARAIEAAYMDRLNNPVPLTILGIPRDVWESWTVDERKDYRQQYIDGRKAKNGAVAMKVAEFPIDMPGQSSVDLYESGRNAVRLDLANHTSTPASLLEGTQQGGAGSSEIKYTGVANGANRSELWDFGLARRWTLAVEGRLSLDDVCAPGLSIRGDISNQTAAPTPAMNPTSED